VTAPRSTTVFYAEHAKLASATEKIFRAVVSQVRSGHEAIETYLASHCRAKCGFARIDMKSNFMNTAFLLMAQYGGKAIVPIEDVCRDYFSHLNPTKLIQKISAGDIAIPLVRMENSQKCAKGVHLLDLAKYLDARVDAARKEMAALTT
jgi:hypothetical protein